LLQIRHELCHARRGGQASHVGGVRRDALYQPVCRDAQDRDPQWRKAAVPHRVGSVTTCLQALSQTSVIKRGNGTDGLTETSELLQQA
jgi:hypothetical protein